tara:strand:+ start:248 stop:490 length:243 start_codon:yes stop_codon:yes gene_type:complete
MKYTLSMLICSLVAGECMPPHSMPEKYNSIYDCLNAGYTESLKKSKEIGRQDVNQHKIYIRFICEENEVIVPLPKPKIET